MAEHKTQSEVTDVEIKSEDSTFIHSVSYGVQDDSFNYPKLLFWSLFGTGIVAVFIVVLIFFAQFSMTNAQRNASVTSSYLEITTLTEKAETKLNSFGVVDLEEGVYRIPIEEAINSMASE